MNNSKPNKQTTMIAIKPINTTNQTEQPMQHVGSKIGVGWKGARGKRSKAKRSRSAPQSRNKAQQGGENPINKKYPNFAKKQTYDLQIT